MSKDIKQKPKVLYSICGTGFGHISRAMALRERLEKKYDVDYVIGGLTAKNNIFEDAKVIYSPMLYCKPDGDLDLLKTVLKLRPIKLIKELFFTDHKIRNYDFVILDNEFIIGYKTFFMKGIKVVSYSHQNSFLFKETPQPKPKTLFEFFNRIVSNLVFKFFSPCKKENRLGFHYKKYNERIMYPFVSDYLIKNKDKVEEQNKKIVVYLMNDLETIVKHLKRIPDYNFEIYHPDCPEEEQIHSDNVRVFKPNKQKFMDAILSCEGVITKPGFTLTAEVLFLNKKLMCIETSNQWETNCNAYALAKFNVPTYEEFHFLNVRRWLRLKSKPAKLKGWTTPKELIKEIKFISGL